MTDVRMHDYEPVSADVRQSVVEGLRASPKRLPCKLFYDERGSQLFERICELEEYYLTRTETAILRESLPDMARRLGPACMVIEYGSGSGEKSLLLLDELADAVAYVPIDISRDFLLASAQRLQARYPEVEIVPVCADYTQAVRLPPTKRAPQRRVVFFPGSTIGNFHHDDAISFVHHVAEVVGKGGALLIGADLQKDREILERAYDDDLGVTAEFNLNILERINRELGADFRIDRFRHRAVYNEGAGRIEMHLESLEGQTVTVGAESFSFRAGETIWTESSAKYRLEQFREMAHAAGFEVEEVWTDPKRWFSVQLLTVPA